MATRMDGVATHMVRALRFKAGSSNATVARQACSMFLADWSNVVQDPAAAKTRVSQQIVREQPRRLIGMGWLMSMIVSWIVGRVLNWLLEEARRDPVRFAASFEEWPESTSSD